MYQPSLYAQLRTNHSKHLTRDILPLHPRCSESLPPLSSSVPSRGACEVDAVSLRFCHFTASNGCRGLEKAQAIENRWAVSGGFRKFHSCCHVRLGVGLQTVCGPSPSSSQQWKVKTQLRTSVSGTELSGTHSCSEELMQPLVQENKVHTTCT